MDSRHDWYNEEKVVSSIQCVIACAALHQQSYAAVQSCSISIQSPRQTSYTLKLLLLHKINEFDINR